MLLLLIEGDAPVIRVEFQTDGFIAASDVGTLLNELDAAFQRYTKAKQRRSNLRLAVKRVIVSSLIADLVVVSADTVMNLSQHPQIISGFIDNIANLVTIAQGIGKGKPSPKDRKLIKAIQAPIAKGDAVQFNIFIVGDGNTVTVDKDVIRRMDEAEEATKIESLLPPEKFHAIAPMSERPTLLKLRGKFGRALLVKGDWYVRLEGEGGVLNPVSNGFDANLEDDQAYSFDGEWEGRSYVIRQAQPL